MSTVASSGTQKILDAIESGKHDDGLSQIALAAHQRSKRVRILRRQQVESPTIRMFADLVTERPGLTAMEYAALMGVTASRIYQLGNAGAERKYVQIDRTVAPRRFFPKDS